MNRWDSPPETRDRRVVASASHAGTGVVPAGKSPEASDGPARADLVERAYAEARKHHFDAVVVTDLDGRIVEWSGGSARLYGYTREEALGRPVDMLHVPEDRMRLLDAVMTGLARDGRWEGQVRMLRKDGSTGWIESAVVPVRDDADQVVGALGINRDITARLQAERELREAEERYRSLVEHALIGIHIIRDDRFLYANPRLVEMLGYTREDLIERLRVSDLIAEHDRERMAENVRLRMAGETLTEPYSFAVRHRDGTLLDVEVFGNRIPYGEAGEYAIIGMVRDVTRQRAEERRALERSERYRQIVEEMFDRAAEVIAARAQTRETFLSHAGSAGPAPAGPGATEGERELSESDRRFLVSVRAAVEGHLSEDDYTVERLAADVNQSRSQLHRRLRALVAESPSELIWRMRLERARALLEGTDEPLMTIAHAVGFKSLPHFSTRFLKQYGVRPSSCREGPS